MHDEKDMIEINLSAGTCEATASSYVKNIRAMKFKNPAFHKADSDDDFLQREGNMDGCAGERRLYCADCQQRLKTEGARFAMTSLCCLPVVPINLLYHYCWGRGQTAKGICRDCNRNLSS